MVKPQQTLGHLDNNLPPDVYPPEPGIPAARDPMIAERCKLQKNRRISAAGLNQSRLKFVVEKTNKCSRSKLEIREKR
jgi:hypothetical protein